MSIQLSAQLQKEVVIEIVSSTTNVNQCEVNVLTNTEFDEHNVEPQ